MTRKLNKKFKIKYEFVPPKTKEEKSETKN